MGSVAKESNDDWDISALSELVNEVLNAVSRNVTSWKHRHREAVCL